MNKGRNIIILVIIVGGVIASLFMVGGADVAKWNDKVIAIHKRYGMDWKGFEASIVPWLQGKALDAEKAEAAYRTYTVKVGQTAAEIKRELPPKDKLCQEFHGLLVQYGDLQQSQLTDLRKLLDEMKAANPGSEADRTRVASAIDALGAKETALQNAVQAKQKEMAAKFKLQLK